METYPNRHSVMPEPKSTEKPVPHFPWMNPGNFFSASKISLNPFQPTELNLKHEVANVPIRSIASVIEAADNTEFEAPLTRDKKKKGTNQIAPDVLSPKKPKRKPSASKKAKGKSKPGANIERKNLNVVFEEADFSGVPPPFCSCTGIARGCYKWGAGGWQSSCCNSSLSEYPLPMSSSRPGARLAGRKMSHGAYEKLLYKLAADGHDLSQPVDLKDHWAKHGTNKFVTIK